MAKKQYDYFKQFREQVTFCKKAAEQLVNMVGDYTDIILKSEEIHLTEHEGDTVFRDIMSELNQSFITPIDREDIVALAAELDDITDSIEDVANLFDILGIEILRPEVEILTNLIFEGCSALHDAVFEFHNFKRSKRLSDLLARVSRIEEDGDRMHRSIMRALYQNETDAIELLKWTQIYDTLEAVLDDCEDVALLIDGLVIKNS